MTTFPDRDPMTLMSEIDALQKRLAELDHELKDAMAIYRDARYQLLIADTKRQAVRSDIEITKARSMSLMAMLRAIPK